MSVCSGSRMQCDSLVASTESKRQSSTCVACSEKIAKLTPAPSHVPPKGYGRPGQTLIVAVPFSVAKHPCRSRDGAKTVPKILHTQHSPFPCRVAANGLLQGEER